MTLTAVAVALAVTLAGEIAAVPAVQNSIQIQFQTNSNNINTVNTVTVCIFVLYKMILIMK